MTNASQISIREIDWLHDGKSIVKLDASFTTDKIYRVNTGENSFELIEHKLDSPLAKTYRLDTMKQLVAEASLAIIAEINNEIAAIMTVKYEAWNRRAWLTHLYVGRDFKNRGIGTTLINEAIKFARKHKARCLWLETQNVNFPAIQFYRKIGFKLCGFDASLYDPRVAPGETALFFEYTLVSTTSGSDRGL